MKLEKGEGLRQLYTNWDRILDVSRIQNELGHNQTNKLHEWYGQRKENALSTSQKQLSQKNGLIKNIVHKWQAYKFQIY